MFLHAAISPQHDWNSVLTNQHPGREHYPFCVIFVFLLSEKAHTTRHLPS